jgi:hypothetical protein
VSTTPLYRYLGRLPMERDHVRATEDFRRTACLAVARGAIGDCTRTKGHDGPHQGAQGYAWTELPEGVEL